MYRYSKNHNITYSLDQAQYTCCLKSFVGVLTAPSRTFGENSFHGENLPEHVAEINLCRPYLMKNGRPGVTLNIVDATRIIVDGGPHNSIFGGGNEGCLSPNDHSFEGPGSL